MPQRQASAWGQFWFDLSERHRIYGAGVTTPLQTHLPKQPWKKPYHGMWFTIIREGEHKGAAVYKEAQGDTMTDYLRDGLRQWEVDNLHMKMLLLAVVMEEVDYKLSRWLLGDKAL